MTTTTPLQRLVSKVSSRYLCLWESNLLRFGSTFQTPTASSRNGGRWFSSDAKSSGTEWRKAQLDKLESKFKGNESGTQQQQQQLESLSIESEDDLQPMWKAMEGRVTTRKLRSLADTGGKSGRMNIKKTEEDVWLQEGLYSADNDGVDKYKSDDGSDSSKKE